MSFPITTFTVSKEFQTELNTCTYAQKFLTEIATLDSQDKKLQLLTENWLKYSGDNTTNYPIFVACAHGILDKHFQLNDQDTNIDNNNLNDWGSITAAGMEEYLAFSNSLIMQKNAALEKARTPEPVAAIAAPLLTETNETLFGVDKDFIISIGTAVTVLGALVFFKKIGSLKNEVQAAKAEAKAANAEASGLKTLVGDLKTGFYKLYGDMKNFTGKSSELTPDQKRLAQASLNAKEVRIPIVQDSLERLTKELGEAIANKTSLEHTLKTAETSELPGIHKQLTAADKAIEKLQKEITTLRNELDILIPPPKIQVSIKDCKDALGNKGHKYPTDSAVTELKNNPPQGYDWGDVKINGEDDAGEPIIKTIRGFIPKTPPASPSR